MAVEWSLPVFSGIYWLFAWLLMYPPPALQASQITIPSLLRHYVGTRKHGLVRYYMRLGTITLLLHSSLVLAYTVLSWLLFGSSFDSLADKPVPLVVHLAGVAAFLVAAVALTIGVRRWNDLSRHPTARDLSVYGDWVAKAIEIEHELRNPLHEVAELNREQAFAVTDSWVIHPTMYGLDVAMNASSTFSLIRSTRINSYSQSRGSEAKQMLTVLVSCPTTGKNFHISLFSEDYQRIQRRLDEKISNTVSIIVQQTLDEQFLECFADQVATNSRDGMVVYRTSGEGEDCFAGCGNVANVKIWRQCDGEGAGLSGAPACEQCHCKPTWCVECLGKWYARAQNQSSELWLRGSANCPTCRAVFCPLDVVPAEFTDSSDEHS